MKTLHVLLEQADQLRIDMEFMPVGSIHAKLPLPDDLSKINIESTVEDLARLVLATARVRS